MWGKRFLQQKPGETSDGKCLPRVPVATGASPQIIRRWKFLQMYLSGCNKLDDVP